MNKQITTAIKLITLPLLMSMLSGCFELLGDEVQSAAAAIAANSTAPVYMPNGDINKPPVIGGTAASSVEAGGEYSFTPSAADADGDTLTFAIVSKPAWASFDETTGNLRGVPSAGDAGTYPNIVITVNDGSQSVSLPSFSIVVEAAASTPTSQPPVNQDYVGFGAATQGAGSCPTGMTTYNVTSLSGGSGSGTLRDAVSADCRNIVFDVAGDIDLGDLQISNSFLTIDGSSAPSPGITLVNVGRLAIEARGGVAVHDIIVNNIRAIGRGGATETNDLWELDGSSGAPIYSIVLDHLTMIASADGNVDVYGDVNDITLSNSLITDSIQGHHFSQSAGLRERLTIYGNVYARLNERQPRIRYNTRQLDFIGNVIYGWGWFEGGASGMNLDIAQGTPSANVENNTYQFVPGLSGSADNALKIDSINGSWFFNNNTWPDGENTGDGASNSNMVSMVYQGVDYAAPRQRADVLNAGTHYKTADEQLLLETILGDIGAASGGTGGTGSTGGTGGGAAAGGATGGGDTTGGSTGGSTGGTTGGGSGSVYVPPANPSAYRGIPDPNVELGFDVWGDYPADQTITGEQGKRTLSCTGTAAAPCMIDASGASFTDLALAGSYVILQGGIVNAPVGSGYWFDTLNCSNCVVRDLEIAGPGIDSSFSSVVGMGSKTVWIRGSIHDFGDKRVSARENDFHGFKVLNADIWILEAEIYFLSGDGVQVGNVSANSSARVYIGGGFYHNNRENAVDIKSSRDVVVTGVLMEGFRPTNSSPGEAVILHNDAFNTRVFNNVIRDSTLGLVSSGKDGHIIQDNDITALDTGIELRSTTNITVTGNTISAPTRINVQGGVTGTVQN